MPPAPELGTWLLIVQRARRGVYERLRQSFAANPAVEILRDRRRGDRRTRQETGHPERRHGERRQPIPAAEVAFGRRTGFMMVARQ